MRHLARTTTGMMSESNGGGQRDGKPRGNKGKYRADRKTDLPLR